jgi:hypothetical protein
MYLKSSYYLFLIFYLSQIKVIPLQRINFLYINCGITRYLFIVMGMGEVKLIKIPKIKHQTFPRKSYKF